MVYHNHCGELGDGHHEVDDELALENEFGSELLT
jgi:hypothetical protein